MKSARLVSINRGKPKAVEMGKGKTFRSSIQRQAVEVPVFVSRNGMDQDQVADPLIHGGPDKAICAYSMDHRTFWEKTLSRKIHPGMFGENFSLEGLNEKQVCVGDVYQAGEAVFEVSQPRQPCFKLNRVMNFQEMACKIKTTGYSGFYLRVLEPGWVESGMDFSLVKRGPGVFSVERIYRLLDRKYFTEKTALQVLEHTPLSKSFACYIEKRLKPKA